MPRHFELHKEAEALTPIVRRGRGRAAEPGPPGRGGLRERGACRALEGPPGCATASRPALGDRHRAARRSTRSGRASARRPARDGEAGAGDDTGLVERVPCPGPDPQERVAQVRRDAAIGRAIETLPAHYRDALLKFHVEGKGYQAIAREMNVPLGTVATWIARGRKAMAEQLGDEARER